MIYIQQIKEPSVDYDLLGWRKIDGMQFVIYSNRNIHGDYIGDTLKHGKQRWYVDGNELHSLHITLEEI